MNHSVVSDSVRQRIVLINQTPGEGFRALVSSLATMGFKTEAICGTSETRTFNWRVDIDATNVPAPTFHERFAVYRPDSLWSRLSTWLRFTLQAAALLRTLNSDDVVLATSNPPFLPIVAALAKRKRGFKLVTRVLDQYPEALCVLPPVKIFATLSGIGPLWSRLQSWAFTASDEVVAMGPCMAAAIQAMAHNANVSYAAEPQDRPPEPAKSTSEVLQCGFDLRALGDKAVVLFAGNVGLTHDAQMLRRAIIETSTCSDAIVVLVGGSWDTLARLEAPAPPCIFLPYLAAADYSRILQRADIAVIALRKGLRAASFPSRIASFASNGVAVVLATDEPSDAASFIREYACGVVVPASESTALAHAISTLAQDKPLCIRLKHNARLASIFFSPENTVDKLAGVIRRYIHMSQ